jgi:alkanesulfonate monooxygenase SsuD/methylene tetrahydromethanopterin reductase-like flavin-dependent oxidoreductase (luciferase family)
MEIGIGLNATIPGVTGEELTEWARRAEQRGFSSLGTIDRIVYGNYEPLIALAAAAAVTERIRLATTVLLAPLRSNTALFAKQAATLQHLSGGRLVLGLAPGGREDDYDVSDVDFHKRGREFDRQLEEMLRVWAGEEKGFAGPVGPNVDERPTLLIGGQADAAFRRAAEYADGWIMGGGPPDRFRDALARVQEAWQAAGRTDKPRTAALAYYALGDEAEHDAQAYLGDYYAFTGEETADAIAGSAAKDPDTVKQYVSAFEQAGCDELILFPSNSDPEQVDLLAEAIS